MTNKESEREHAEADSMGEKNDSEERGVFEGITYERVKENVREGGWRQ